MHEFLSHFWIRCPYYTLTTPYNCLILMFSSKICYLFTVCTRSHDPLSGENLSPHLVKQPTQRMGREAARLMLKRLADPAIPVTVKELSASAEFRE